MFVTSPSKWVILAFSFALLAACGGGGGGSSAPNTPDEPNDSNNPPQQKPVAGLGFDSTASDIALVVLPDENSDSTLVLMRNAGAERVVFVLQDGTVIEAEQNGDGQLGLLRIGEHEFVFTDYTETTVTVNYLAPGGAVVSEVIDRATGDAATMTSQASLMKPMADQTLSEYLDEKTKDTLAWLQDPGNQYLPLLILRSAGETVANLYESARARLESVLESTSEMVSVVHNELACDIAPDTCAVQIAGNITTVMQELESLDPSAQTTAGLDVTANGIQPRRDEWESESNLDFTMVDVPCSESVFADMNPDCPQYVPPVTDPTNPGEDDPLSASDSILHTPVNTALTGELSASGATAYQLQSQPANGSVTINQAMGGFTYTPDTDYTGVDSFTFVASNGDKTSREATITIEVGELERQAFNSSISTASNTPVSSNFQHVGATYFRVVQQPMNGTLTALDLTEGTFTYTPNNGFTGTDEIHFVAAGASGDSEPAIVTINVGSAGADCEHSILTDGTSMYRCEDYIEYWWGNLEYGGFTRTEDSTLGQFGNSWYIQIEDGEITVYSVDNNIYENGQLTYIEEYSLSVAETSTHNEMDHRVEVRTYEGSTRTSTTRTVIDCSNYEIRRRVFEGQFSYTPVEDETFDTREICPTVEDAKALAGSVMDNAAMSISYVTSSPAYTMATQAP